MKLKTSLLILTVACGTLWAQNPPDKNAKPTAKTPAPAAKNAPAPAAKTKTPAPAAKTTAAKAPVPAAKTSAATPAKTTAPVAAQHKPAPKPVVVPQARPVAAPVPKPKAPAKQAKTPMQPKVIAHMLEKKAPEAGEVKPASAKETTRVSSAKQRDPFVSPIMRSNGVIGSGCDTGKRCLVVDQIVLKGIVKSPSGFIAVVENPAKRAYFMRENDPVFNGKVVKITGDTIVFQEEVLDKLGKQSMREVVKKVNAPVV